VQKAVFLTNHVADTSKKYNYNHTTQIPKQKLMKTTNQPSKTKAALPLGQAIDLAYFTAPGACMGLNTTDHARS